MGSSCQGCFGFILSAPDFWKLPHNNSKRGICSGVVRRSPALPTRALSWCRSCPRRRWSSFWSTATLVRVAVKESKPNYHYREIGLICCFNSNPAVRPLSNSLSRSLARRPSTDGAAGSDPGNGTSLLPGLLLRSLSSVTIIQKPYYLLHVPILVIYKKFLNSNPLLLGPPKPSLQQP